MRRVWKSKEGQEGSAYKEVGKGAPVHLSASQTVSGLLKKKVLMRVLYVHTYDTRVHAHTARAHSPSMKHAGCSLLCRRVGAWPSHPSSSRQKTCMPVST